MMLTFFTPGTCSSRWRKVSASRTSRRCGFALRLERVQRKGDVRVFVVDHRPDHAGGRLAASSPIFLRAW